MCFKPCLNFDAYIWMYVYIYIYDYVLSAKCLKLCFELVPIINKLLCQTLMWFKLYFAFISFSNRFAKEGKGQYIYMYIYICVYLILYFSV